MKRLFFILTLISHFGYSQHSSQLGRFSIEYSSGCLPVTVSIQEHDSFGNISRQYFYEEGLIETPDTFHTYSNAGTYAIVQFLGEDIVPKTDTLIFEVLESYLPEYSVAKCSNTEAKVIIEEQDPYDYHIVWFSETDSVEIRSGNNSNASYDFGQSTGLVRVKGFYESAYPTCGSSTYSLDLSQAGAEQIKSSELIQVCQDNYYLNMELANHSELSFLQVDLINNNDRQTIHTGTLSDSIVSFPISQNLESEAYCIDLSVLNACDLSILSTANYCDSVNENSANLAEAHAGYVSNDVLISFDTLRGKNVQIDRRILGRSEFISLGAHEASYLDSTAVSTRQYEYRLIEFDTCQNFLDTVLVAPPYIKLTDRNRYLNTISFDAFPPMNLNGNYQEEFVLSSVLSDSEISYDYQEVYKLPGGLGSTIRVRAVYRYDDLILFSNEILTPYEEVVFVPTAFSPNQDGVNDELFLFGLPNNNFTITIYDRWGKNILTTSNNPVWNGFTRKELAPEGTYLYQLSFEQENGVLKEQVGTFTLLRK
ncbi:MAG: gliding motility-associated C-terminal domain-containing protein [Cyclobacteriaceae bacterium]